MIKINKTAGLFLFLLVLFADLVVVYIQNDELRYITKPLLMPLLVVYFIVNTRSFVSGLKKWIILALVFSWLGDLLLMFESVNNIFFMFGLIAFLFAHIFYILFFESILKVENLSKKYWLFIPVLIYYVTLIYILSPHLGEMKLPVRIYGVVISYMLIQALQVTRINNKVASALMICGAVLFITSDSLLAINKFYKPFELAGILIMVTYGMAQLLITVGATRYINSVPKG